MTHLYIWFLAFALAIDCFAVSVVSGTIYARVRWKKMLTMAFLFGLFQALNPLIGWLATDYFRHIIEEYDHWIAFAILAFLGVRMMIDSFKDEEHKVFNPRSLKVIFTLAIATSIDALAVGISFSCMGVTALHDLLYPLFAIGVVSFTMSILGLFIGIYGARGVMKRLRAELVGGMVLIAIGIKVLFEHLSA